MPIACINTKDIFNPIKMLNIQTFKPDIIHYLTGATIRSFMVLHLLKKYYLGKPKTILSATRVFLDRKQLTLIRYLKPDLILTQAMKWENHFISANIDVKFIQNSINLGQFKKGSYNKKSLREKYGLPSEWKIILHVGHIKRNRNLEFFIENCEYLKREGFLTVIVGSTFHEIDLKLQQKLIKAGITVLSEYFPHIEEIYQASDIFVFPVKGLQSDYYPSDYQEVGVIDMPLSIIEAMVCGIPVVSTPVDSFKRMIRSGVDLPITFFNPGNPDSFRQALTACNLKKRTRQPFPYKIFSEETAMNEILSCYQRLIP